MNRQTQACGLVEHLRPALLRAAFLGRSGIVRQIVDVALQPPIRRVGWNQKAPKDH